MTLLMLFFQIFMGIVLAEMQMFYKDPTGRENLNRMQFTKVYTFFLFSKKKGNRKMYLIKSMAVFCNKVSEMATKQLL